MKVLYIGVHDYKNENKWRTETFVANAFGSNGVDVELLDYRSILKRENHAALERALAQALPGCDAIFLQRGEGIKPALFEGLSVPVVFWSTEPINRNKDVDVLLQSNIFDWVYFHTYSCVERMQREFPHLSARSSVLHNALAAERIQLESDKRDIFAIFNRNLSWRRRRWLWPSRKLITVIRGRYGDAYYEDLNRSQVAVNVHYGSKSVDDFETGIFEAMASGCVVVSETIRQQVLVDLQLNDALIQVDSPQALRQALIELQTHPERMPVYLRASEQALQCNTWDFRFRKVVDKLRECTGVTKDVAG